MTKEKPLGLGLVGCGGFGLFCMEAFSQLPDVEPVAVADVVPAAAQHAGERFGVPAFLNPAELIARDDIDLVHVATPPSTHHGLVLAAAAAGKHVLCEKPLAMNLAQADEMLAAVAQAGVIAPVNFVLRYNAVTDAVSAILASGVLGQPLSARLTNCASDDKLVAEHWFWDKSVSGGIFVEHGVHFFDLYRHWLGPGEVISAHTESRGPVDTPKGPVVCEDRVTCTLRHQSGAIASHYHGFDQAGPMDRTDHRIVCELGDIRVAGWIPLACEVDALVDEAGAVKLAELCSGAEIETIERFPTGQDILGRGKLRPVTRRVRMRYEPETDKQAIYAQSVRALLADQIAYIRDGSHQRRITEQDGRDAVALAQAAAEMAG